MAAVFEAAPEVSQLWFVEVFGPNFSEADLDGGVPVRRNTLELRDNAGTCFYHGDRRNGPVFVEDLGHADLPAQNCVYQGFLRACVCTLCSDVALGVAGVRLVSDGTAVRLC
jgi:hypothetical protein